jgi:hypothetical protein
MARYRLFNREYRCEDEHQFTASIRYEYKDRTTEFQVRPKNPDLSRGTWADPWLKFPVCPECEKIVVTPPLVNGEVVRRNVHVPDSEASAVGIHPVTGDITYCFDKPGQPLPKHWADLGYQKVTFNHYADLQRFCRQTGNVNDIEGDWAHDEGYYEEQREIREKVERERRERYLEEREKVMKAYPELRKRGI